MFLINDEIDTIRRSRSTVGILASSLAFEAAILGPRGMDVLSKGF